MNIFLSLNSKMMNVNVNNFFEILIKNDTSKIIKGIEMYASTEDEFKYTIEFAEKCMEYGYTLNLHGPLYTDFSKYQIYLDFVKELGYVYNKRPHIVFHSQSSSGIATSILDTITCINKIFNYINEKDIKNIENISIENLNYVCEYIRLNKENLTPILAENTKLKFTYDMGHALIDGILESKLDNFFLKRLSNIHIHTFKDNEDHKAIDMNDKYLTKLKTSLVYILQSGYTGPIVLEYSFDYISGNTTEDKIISYINSAKTFKNIFE